VRSTANYLLAYASVNPKVKMYLKEYFDFVIKLPKDLLEVVEYS